MRVVMKRVMGTHVVLDRVCFSCSCIVSVGSVQFGPSRASRLTFVVRFVTR